MRGDGALVKGGRDAPAARELGVNLGSVKGSGNKGRIAKEDVEAAAKGGGAPAKAAPAAAGGGVGGIELLPWPKVAFSDLIRA